jgi:hypothetical protein
MPATAISPFDDGCQCLTYFDITSGRRKYTAGNIDRRRYDRLVNLGWLTSSATNISDIDYQVTEKGRAAAVVE